jgi:hypothetical protein
MMKFYSLRQLERLLRMSTALLIILLLDLAIIVANLYDKRLSLDLLIRSSLSSTT